MSSIVTLTMNPALDVSTSTSNVQPTDKLRCAKPTFEPGGGGINVARVVHTLGGEVTAIFPSGGASGATVEQLLSSSALPCLPIPISQATRESLTVDETESGDQYRFVMPGPAMSEAELATCVRALEAIAPTPSFVVASGSLPPGVASGFYTRIADVCARTGAKLLLDTSGEPLREVQQGTVFLLKPNLKEAEALLGRDISGEKAEVAAAAELVDSGRAQNVVISLGARGAIFADRSGIERLAPIPVVARSAVGAGDSMVAGVVFGLDHGLPVREAVRLGLAAGAAALLTVGSGLARRADVERLFGQALPT